MKNKELKKKFQRGIVLMMALILLVSFTDNRVMAETNTTKEINKVAKTIDGFIWSIIFESNINVYEDEKEEKITKKEFDKYMKIHYNGKLTNQVKTIIATRNLDYKKDVETERTWEKEDFTYILTVSEKTINTKIKNIFGKKLDKIDLPIWKDKNSLNDFTKEFYLGGLAKSEAGKIYIINEEFDSHTEFKYVTKNVEKSGNTYTVTRQYKYYRYFLDTKPQYIVNATITIKKNSNSSYGYNIVGLKLKTQSVKVEPFM